MKSIEEAIAVRDRIIDNFAKAANLSKGKERDRLLTVTVIGGGFAGIETFAELRSLASAMLRQYPELTIDDTKFHMVEAMSRVMPEVSLKTFAVGSEKPRLAWCFRASRHSTEVCQRRPGRVVEWYEIRV